MRAALYHGPGDVRIGDVPEPEPDPGQVLIRVELCGICGTDLHEFYDGPVFCPTAHEPHPLTGSTAPVVLGHEFVGVVEQVGVDVADLEVGARVVVEPRQTCGECRACTSGHYNRCARAATIGLQGGGGGLAERIAVDASLVHAIGLISPEVGAVVEPLAVAMHAVRVADVPIEGAHAVVFGAGPIGLLISWVLRKQGAASVTVVEPSPTRRERAGHFGADSILDPARDDVSRMIMDATSREGADLALECAGVDASLAGCIDAVRPGGTVVNVAIAGKPLTVDLLPLIVKEARIFGSICYADDHPAAIQMLTDHEFPVEQFVTSRIQLEDLVEKGIRAMGENPESQVKVLVAPSAAAVSGSL
jgi:(R,R)-butanediol dehydrogenase/meso-butanediol dehydrogenase/diacetyl reductase